MINLRTHKGEDLQVEVQTGPKGRALLFWKYDDMLDLWLLNYIIL